MAKFKIFQVERPWGNFRQFSLNSLSTIKIVTMKPNEQLSLQSHSKRTEFWRILNGSGVVEIGDNTRNVSEGDELDISIGIKHRAMSGPLGLVFLEIAEGEFEEGDEIRFEDKYDRP